MYMKFSVVVPVYKVEEYINECVDSILNQSFDDFEVILVDDGSPDNCGKICDEYAKKDERVRVIHKENGGLVSARQAGIKIARGEYIVNIDSDDYIDKDMLKNSDEIINSYSPDAIYFSMMNFKGQKRWTFDECIKEGFYDEKDIKEKIYPYALLSADMQNLNYLVTVKVVKREILEPIQLSVSCAISYAEDVACSVPMIASIKSLYVSIKPMYNYRHRTTSMSNKLNIKWLDSVNECICGLDKVCSDRNGFAEQIDRYTIFITFVILNIAVRAKRHDAIPEIAKKVYEYNFIDRFKRAKFGKITLKTKISYFLMKRGNFKLTYNFLKMCNFIKTSK